MSSPYPPASGAYGGYSSPAPGQYPPAAGQYGSQPAYGGPPNQGYGSTSAAPSNQYGAPPPQSQYAGYQQPAGGGYGQPQQYQQGGGYPSQSQGAGYSQGGYGGPPGAGDQDHQQLRSWFNSVDVDGSGYITQIELKQALVNGDWTPFSDETVKMLMNIFDTDRNGTIGFNEFHGLWQYIKEWQVVFRTFDADRSGTIESRELSNALSRFGYNLSPRLIEILEKKYVPPVTVLKPGQSGQMPPQPRGITFDRFVRCCVAVRNLSDSFKRADHDQDGWVTMSYEQFLEMVLAAP